MGCQSSKAPSCPVETPAGTLLHATSPKATQKSVVMPESTTEAYSPSPLSPRLAAVEAALSIVGAPEGTSPTSQDIRFPKEEASLEAEPVETMPSTVAETDHNIPPKSEGMTLMPFAEAHEVSTGSERTSQCTQEPTSKVHKKPQGWEEEGILFPHEGVRFLMQELSDAVNSMDPLPAWKWANLLTWYQDYFCSVVHHHHDAEEKIYFPWIETRVQVPAKISTEHPELMKAMDDLSSMLKDGAAAPAGGRSERLADVQRNVAAFVEDMLEHLAEEEEIIPCLLREGGFTQKEEGAVVGQIIQSLGLDGNKKALPPMLHAYALWAGKDKAEAFVSGHLPPPIQFLYRNFWEYDFQHRHMGLLASLAEGVDTNPFASKWFC